MSKDIQKTCLICGSHQFTALEKESRFKKLDLVAGQFIVRCKGCGIVTREPSIFSPEFDMNAKLDLRTHQDFIGGETGHVANYLKERLEYAESKLTGWRVLDVGSGSGAFLLHAKNRGWSVCGTEREPTSIDKLRANDIPYFEGELDDPAFADSRFDLIHINHVFEHLRDPLKTLRDVEKLMTDDGLVIIEVPNEFEALTQRARMLLGLDGSSETSYFQHEWFFTPQTLRRTCERSDLKIKKLYTPFRNSGSATKDLPRKLAGALGYGDVIEVHLA